MEVEFTNDEEVDNSLSMLGDNVDKEESELKNYIVNYVGNKLEPENGEINVGMVINVFADEFPEFVLALAEENWIRGYHQALNDVDEGKKIAEEENADKQE